MTGSIVNAGTILAKTGVSIVDSTIQGAIVDGSRIVAANFGANGVLVSGGDVFGGIQIGSHGAISAFSGVKVFGATALGGIVNSGVVAAGRTGVNISGVTTLSGGIVNRGTITAGQATLAMGIAVTQVSVFGDSSTGGGITNTGTISAAFNAIQLPSVPTFEGAIVNSGRLVAETGIHYGFFAVFGGSASGGITNSGTITASDRGILLANGTIFNGVVANSSVIAAHGTGIWTLSGGVSNSGKITAISGAGIQISKSSSTTVLGSTSAGGSVVNSGTISAAQGIVVQADTIAGAIINANLIVAKGDPFAHSDGIVVRGVGTFLGGVSNRGSISARHIGIEFGKSTTNAFGVSSVVGSIVNSGTITAKTGIALYASTITSAIIDSGSIKATSHGILIERASEILSSKTAIDIAGPTFTGGISNSGVISGSAGIEIKSAHPVSIFDAGRHRRHRRHGDRVRRQRQHAHARRRLHHQRHRRSLGQQHLPARRERLRYVRSQLDRERNTRASPPSTWSAAPGRSPARAPPTGPSRAASLEVASGGELTSTTVSSGGVLVVEFRRHREQQLRQGRRHGNHRVGRRRSAA